MTNLCLKDVDVQTESPLTSIAQAKRRREVWKTTLIRKQLFKLVIQRVETDDEKQSSFEGGRDGEK